MKQESSHSLGGLKHVTLVLHDIRSVINVGAMFRTAEGFGVGKILLSGYTPGPLDRFGRERDDFKKAALGSEGLVSWERLDSLENVLLRKESQGAKLVVLEQSSHAVDIREANLFSLEGDVFLVVGNEVEGVDSGLIERADSLVEIPMFGKKESFNVSVSLGIILYAFL